MVMIQEEKQLLLKDLSARLAYGVFCVGITYELDDDGEEYIPVKVKNTLTEIHNYKLETSSVRLGLISSCELETVKPYLRPMSSMTEEEKKEWHATFESVYNLVPGGDPDNEDDYDDNWHEEPGIESYDYLNAHHFDYRGLIDKGLAIEVTEENNPYKNDI